MGQKTKTLSNLSMLVADVISKNIDATMRWRQQCCHNFQQRRLSRSVGSEKGDGLSRWDSEAETTKHPMGTKTVTQIRDGEGWGHLR